MTGSLGSVDTRQFLARYWQREPLLIRGAFEPGLPDFSADDLAGLACEPMAESRIVCGPGVDSQWTLEHGPFDESRFDELGQQNWTLLVQDVEKHYPPLNEWLAAFNFLPSWRLDDLMISFAATGGSVGPHVDQYDVFLVQVEGDRRWEIAREFDPKTRTGVPLDMLENFSVEESWDLGPGDLLYLPPGVAHHGVALTPCMTASVGLRAPSQSDFLLALGEMLSTQPAMDHRYRDPDLLPCPQPGRIDEQALQKMQALLRDAVADESTMNHFLARFMSTYRLAHEPTTDPEFSLVQAGIFRDRPQVKLSRHPWTRINWIESDGQATLYSAGLEIRCSPVLAIVICGPQPFSLHSSGQNLQDRTAVTRLLEEGHLYIHDDH